MTSLIKRIAITISITITSFGSVSASASDLGGESLSESSPEIVGAVVFSGVSVFAPEALQETYGDVLGLPLTEARSKQLTDNLVALYARSGYLAPGIQINRLPDEPAILKVTVRESQLTDVVVKSTNRKLAAKVEAAAMQLLASGPLNEATAQQFEVQLEEMLGKNIGFSFKQVENASVDQILEINLSDPMDVSVRMSSEGSKQLGREILSTSIVFNEPMDIPAQFVLFATDTVNTDGYISGGVRVNVPLADKRGMSLDWGIMKAETQDEPEILTATYNRKRVRLSFYQDVEFDTWQNLRFVTAFTARDSIFQSRNEPEGRVY